MVQQNPLTCSCGHSWVPTTPGPFPEDLRAICPVCSGATQGTNTHSPETEPSGGEGALGTLEPGRVLAGFEIIEELNRGGMGVIYKARQQGLNRLVALKVIAPERLGHRDALRRFQREVQAAALLSHPNIVTVYHSDLEGPWPYLAMEYVAGIDLFHLVQQAGPLPVTDACFYIQQAAHGLQHAFEAGLVHRDIKPANLMVTPSPLDRSPAVTTRLPRIKILDMGLARLTAALETGETGSNLTQAGAFLGTPDFMSPEQAEDPRRADIRSDLYSLGGTLYFLLIGEVPFPGGNLVQKIRRQLMGPPPSLSARRSDVPPDLDALCRRLMACDPAERFQTPAELIAAFDAMLRKPEATPPPPAARAPAAPTPATAPAPAPASQHRAIRVRAHSGSVQALGITGDGRFLLSGGVDEVLRLWDAVRLREVRTIAGDVGPVEHLALAPGGKWAASCSLRLFKQDMVVQLWDLASGTERRRLRGHTDAIRCVAIAPDGRRVAAGGVDRTIRVWSLESPTSPPLCLKGHTGPVSSVAFLPLGESLLSGSQDGTVRMWDSKTGGSKGQLAVQAGKISAVVLDPTSKRMAIAGNVLRVRERDGTLFTLNGHQGSVLCVVFSPDGRLLLSGGSDHTVRLWRVEEGEEAATLEGHGDKVHAVVFSPDGQTGFSASADGTIRRWPLST